MHITIWRTRNGMSHTYTELNEFEAIALVDLVTESIGFLIADASPELGPRIHPRIRTSWYTRDLPEESPS